MNRAVGGSDENLDELYVEHESVVHMYGLTRIIERPDRHDGNIVQASPGRTLPESATESRASSAWPHGRHPPGHR